MPLDAQNGFFVLTIVSLAVTAFLTWLAARELLGDEDRALVAIPLLFGTWVVAPNIREFGLIDPLAWAFVAGVWLLTLRRNWLLAAIVAAIGAVAKEVVVLAAIAAAAAAFDLRRPWVALGVGLPAILVVLGLTIAFPGSGADAGAYVFKWVRDGLFSNGVGSAVFLLFAAYSVLWFLIPLGLPGLSPSLLRAALVYLAAALVLPIVGSPERMEEAVFPALIALALMATRGWRVPVVWLIALGTALFVARIGGSARLPSIVAWGGLAVALVLVAWGYAVTLAAAAPARSMLLAEPARPRGTTAPSQ
jgi:hypothetical protein